ncbi:hypothetical protein ACFLTP_09315 [Chloroflexota bacterium]
MLQEVVLKVLNPAGEAKVHKKASATRFDSLDGKRLGLVYNRKPRGDVLLARTAELLKTRFKDIDVTWFDRECCKPPSEAYIEAAAKGSDVVVAAAGD